MFLFNSDASRYLVEILTPVSLDERGKWLDRIIEGVHKQSCKILVINRSNLSSSISFDDTLFHNLMFFVRITICSLCQLKKIKGLCVCVCVGGGGGGGIMLYIFRKCTQIIQESLKFSQVN